ncbi:EcsC protein family protein [Paenibacillus sophorae]|uniref:EcsC family protein n=1 Tax=Paenibacillus sophorae TaxID=1333845 RepID=A0A1H8TJU0_9BACL|nr:EcsC family protein [Paenibacillus sophorae]QWU16236.1 EcsC family protein [Paenibacillus sophorae]SEO90843.1 EcsC protein family protein [Paenibacillus sophorae]
MRITQQAVNQALDWAYEKAVMGGIPGTSDAYELAEEFLQKKGELNDQISSLIRWQNTKSATSGFLTGLGGLVTLPAAIPANLASVIYIQLRMIAAIAIMSGRDVKEDQVRTMAYLCLCGNGIKDVLKDVGIVVGKKAAESALRGLSGKVLININKKVGFRLLTKFGTKGVINLSKMIPLVGGVTGAVFDGVSTNVVGNTARRLFNE